MVYLPLNLVIALNYLLLDVRRGQSISIREIEYAHSELFQIVVLARPVIAYHKDIDVQLPHYLRMVELALWNDDVWMLQGFDDGDALLEWNDWRSLIAAHQLIGAHANNQGVAKSTGIFYHLQVVAVEHVEGS